MGRSVIEVKQETYYTLWYQDLQKIINEFYGIEGYEVLGELYDNFKNEMYDVWDTDEFLDYNDEDSLDEWLEDPGPTGVHPTALLYDMAKKGHIPAGKYLIHIWW